MNKDRIKQIIKEQDIVFKKSMNIVERAVPQSVYQTEKVVVITGIRRCGKSTLLRQIARTLGTYNFFNFEDERLLEFTHKDFNTLLECFYELNPERKNIYLFDEIQNVYGWEKFVRRLFNDGKKIFITGSNAKLMSSEIATSLTGRNIRVDLYPFSFQEYLTFYSFPEQDIYTTEEQAALNNHLNDYLKFGGFPEIVKSKDIEETSQLYQDIIMKDLIVRFKIKDIYDFRELSLYLLSNVTEKISYNNLKNLLGFSTTKKVKDYINFFTESYLFFELKKFDYSIKKQIRNERKIYAIDTGIINAVSFQFSPNTGKLLENIVFLELLRRGCELYYYSSTSECDIIVKQGNNLSLAIQVAAYMDDPKTRNREIRGLEKAMEEFRIPEGIIITLRDEGILENRKISILPLWKFLTADYPSPFST